MYTIYYANSITNSTGSTTRKSLKGVKQFITSYKLQYTHFTVIDDNGEAITLPGYTC